MNLPAAMTTAFALGIACGLNPVVAQHNSSREFVAVLLCSAATSLLIGICFVWSSSLTLLLPGDAEKQAEHAMLEEHSDGLHADVLKVGHHGSKNSTTQEFLDTVAPAIAIISAGEDNPYGHPSPELLERLEASGERVLRTDRDGAVHIVTDGDRLEISCFVACPEAPTVTSSRRAQAPNQDQNNQQ
jgi:hypothetical protein